MTPLTTRLLHATWRPLRTGTSQGLNGALRTGLDRLGVPRGAARLPRRGRGDPGLLGKDLDPRRPAPRAGGRCEACRGDPFLCGLEFLTGELKGSHDPSGIVFTVLAAMSGMEREYIRDRTLEGHEFARKRGKTIGGAGVTHEDSWPWPSTCAIRR